jgi:phage terminase small subunit
MALTKKKRLFVAEYLADPKGNARQAVIRAGFSVKRANVTASELLKDPEMKAAIEHKRNEHLKKLEIDAKMVLTDILQTRERCIEAGTAAWAITHRLKCDELLGRYLKLWTEKIEVGFGEEIMKRLEAGRKRAALPPTKGA